MNTRPDPISLEVFDVIMRDLEAELASRDRLRRAMNAAQPLRPVNPRESARIGTKSGRIPGTFKPRKRRSR